MLTRSRSYSVKLIPASELQAGDRFFIYSSQRRDQVEAVKIWQLEFEPGSWGGPGRPVPVTYLPERTDRPAEQRDLEPAALVWRIGQPTLLERLQNGSLI